MTTGWICPKCQQSVAPTEKHCDCDGIDMRAINRRLRGYRDVLPGPDTSGSDCGCSPGAPCLNVACPRGYKFMWTQTTGGANA